MSKKKGVIRRSKTLHTRDSGIILLIDECGGGGGGGMIGGVVLS